MFSKIGEGVRRALLAMIFMVSATSCAATRDQLAGLEPTGRASLAPMLENVIPSVVNVSTTNRITGKSPKLPDDPVLRRYFDPEEFPGETEPSQTAGSGVIVNAERGFVLTNHHLIANAAKITVTLKDGRKLPAATVGADPETDVALIKIDPQRLQALPFGDSQQLRVGDFVVAIGSPFGLNQTVTSGIVSGLSRSGLGIQDYEDFIQTDASINPGNSGGALVDLDGHLIGLNTAIVGAAGNIGIGFAIPSNLAQSVMDQLLRYGEVRRGQLGVGIRDLNPEQSAKLHLDDNGALIQRVQPNSPAAKAGLHPGDIVLAIEGKPVASASALRNALGLLPIGSEVRLDILRDGEKRTLTAQIAGKTTQLSAASPFNERLRGAELGKIQGNHPLSGRIEGVEVLRAEPGSPSWQAGLRPGDVIVAVNRDPVHNTEDLERSAAERPDPLLLHIRRGDNAMVVAIR